MTRKFSRDISRDKEHLQLCSLQPQEWVRVGGAQQYSNGDKYDDNGTALVEQLGCHSLAVVLGTFSVKLSWKDVGIKLLVVVFQFVSMNKNLVKEERVQQRCHI